MKIFVSHSLKDQTLIQDLKTTLEPIGIKIFIAEHNEDLEKTITQKIENMIWQCDIALILLTKNGYKSNFVQQEIGYIKSCQKPSLQIVQTGLEKKISGFLYGKGYVLYDPLQPNLATEKIKRSLMTYWRQLEQKRQHQINLTRQKQIELQKEKEANEAKVGFSILAGLLILGLAGNSK